MTSYAIDPEMLGSTTTVVLMVEKSIRGYERLEIKLRQNSSFGKLVSLLRTKFDYAAKHVLQTGDLDEWKIVFDTDTPASVSRVVSEFLIVLLLTTPCLFVAEARGSRTASFCAF